MHANYRMHAIITHSLYNFYPLFDVQKCFSRGFFLRILALGMVRIQERVMIARLWYILSRSDYWLPSTTPLLSSPCPKPSLALLQVIIITSTENWTKEDKLVKMHWYWVRIVNAHYVISVHPTYLGSIFDPTFLFHRSSCIKRISPLYKLTHN